MSKKKQLLDLFLTMLRIGAFTFGGGYAMIPMLQDEFVDKKGWIGKADFHDMIAISESTPGPIAINNATYIGYKTAKFPGSLIATLGICLPSFTIIFLISLFLDRFLALAAVAAAFRGIRVCVVFLILLAGIRMFAEEKKTPLFFSLLFLTFGASAAFSLFGIAFPTPLFLLSGGTVSLLVYLIMRARNTRKGDKNGQTEDKT